MSYTKQTISNNISLDFFKLECYCKRKNISFRHLSAAVHMSENWLSELQRTSRAKSKPAIISLPVALLLADKLGCTIQDIKLYTPVIAQTDSEESSGVEFENQIKKLAEECIDSKESLPAEFHGQVEFLIKKTVSIIEKDYKTPFFIEYANLAKNCIDKMDELDQIVMALFLMNMQLQDAEIQKNLKLLLLRTMELPRHEYILHNEDKQYDDMQYGGIWWINLFLSELRQEILNVQTKVHIPNETELRRIFTSKSKGDSDATKTSELRKTGEKALESSLKKTIRKIIGAVLDDDTATQNIASMCTRYLCNYFAGSDNIREMQVNLYKDGGF